MSGWLDIKRVMDAVESGEPSGFCVACGEDALGVESDARRHRCESCGELAVFGAEELLLNPEPDIAR